MKGALIKGNFSQSIKENIEVFLYQNTTIKCSQGFKDLSIML